MSVPPRRGSASGFKRFWRAQESDPIPIWLVVGSLVASPTAFVVGGIGSGWANIFGNIMASLTLVGPGLFVTNIFVRNKRRARIVSDIAPALSILSKEAFKLFPLFSTVSEEIGLDVEGFPVDISEFGETPNLRRMAALIEAAWIELREAPKKTTIKPEFNLASSRLAFPSVPIMATMVEYMNQVSPMLPATLGASMVRQGYEKVQIPLIHRGGVEGASDLVHVEVGIESIYTQIRSYDSSGTWGDAPPRELIISAAHLAELLGMIFIGCKNLLELVAGNLPVPLDETQE